VRRRLRAAACALAIVLSAVPIAAGIPMVLRAHGAGDGPDRPQPPAPAVRAGR
jgi:hypothetical protein